MNGFIRKRIAQYNQLKGLRVGDFVKEGKTYLRIAHIWKDENNKPFAWQTEDKAGSYYLGDSYISMSGSLNDGYPEGTVFKRLKETKNGTAWVFKNDIHTAHNGEDFSMKFRVFRIVKEQKEAIQ